jgi:hypothetical protein
MIPEGAPPCHGLGHLFTGGPIDDDLLPDLLACCRRCHLTRKCAQMALQAEHAPGGAISGIWGGVYVTAPTGRPGALSDRRLRALARLQAIAERTPALTLSPTQSAVSPVGLTC